MYGSRAHTNIILYNANSPAVERIVIVRFALKEPFILSARKLLMFLSRKDGSEIVLIVIMRARATGGSDNNLLHVPVRRAIENGDLLPATTTGQPEPDAKSVTNYL